MKKLSLALVLSLSVMSGAEASATSFVPRLMVSPAASLGQIRLGMTRAQVAKLGLATSPATDTSTTQTVGPYYVVYDNNGTVDFVSVELRHTRHGLMNGHKVIASDATIAEAANAFSDCGKLEMRLGGNAIVCEHGGISVLESLPDDASGKNVVRVAVARTK